MNKCLTKFYMKNFCWFYVQIHNYLKQFYSFFASNDTIENDTDSPYKSQLNYHVYDITHDIIKLRYFILNKEHKVCVPRKFSNNLKQIYDNICINHGNCHHMLEYPILDATLNENTDITERLCQYLGHKGSHIIYAHPIKIAWILTPNELKNFQVLTIITDQCKNLTYYDVNEVIMIM